MPSQNNHPEYADQQNDRGSVSQRDEFGREQEHHHRHGRGHGRRDFWGEWRDERHGHGHGTEIQVGQALSPQEMEAWRQFFFKTFGSWPEDHWVFGGRRFSPWHQGMDSFNPFLANLLSKGGGLLPLYVLQLVAREPRYGNEIMDLLAEHTNGQWVANPGAIYPLLTLLEHEGFISGEWEDPEKRTIRVYTITPAGQEEVSRIKSIVLPKVKETIQVLQDLLQDLSQETSGEQEPMPEAPAATQSDGEAR